MPSPWLAIRPDVDPLDWARVLRRAHRVALSDGAMPAVLRTVVSRSWERAVDRKVDPDGIAPAILDERQTSRALAVNPIARSLPTVTRMLSEAIEDAEHFVALSDPDGLLLWADGHPSCLDIAGNAGFLPGHLCSESALGTNAVGTTLALDHPVQIFAAEHFNERLHGLTCAAAPIRDPETRRTVGVLNISGSFRHGHPHSLSLVSLASRLVEELLGREVAERDERLRARYIDLLGNRLRGRSALVTTAGRVIAASPKGWLGSRVPFGIDGTPVLPDGVEVDHRALETGGEAFLVRGVGGKRRRTLPRLAIAPVGPVGVRVSIDGWTGELSPRHSQIVKLLALHPTGLSADQLGRRLYGPGASAVTVRAEVSRLRRLLGPCLRGNPYRLEAQLDFDPAAIEPSQPDATPSAPMTSPSPGSSLAAASTETYRGEGNEGHQPE